MSVGATPCALTEHGPTLAGVRDQSSPSGDFGAARAYTGGTISHAPGS
jgi:hypothetical protein